MLETSVLMGIVGAVVSALTGVVAWFLVRTLETINDSQKSLLLNMNSLAENLKASHDELEGRVRITELAMARIEAQHVLNH